MLKKSQVFFWTFWLLSLPPAFTSANEVAGVNVPEQVDVNPGAVPLSLNGAGIRSKFFIKVYVGALYLPRKAGTAEQVLAENGSKRVAMYILYSEISKEKLVEGWNDGFRNNLAPAHLEQLRDRLERFNALFETVKTGDVILMDYLPEQGTRVTIRGQEKGIVPGKDFNDALLLVWLGEHPASGSLKKAMLGGG